MSVNRRGTHGDQNIYGDREVAKPKKPPRRSFKFLDVLIAFIVAFNVVLVIYLFFVRGNDAFVESIVDELKNNNDKEMVELEIIEQHQYEQRSLISNNEIENKEIIHELPQQQKKLVSHSLGSRNDVTQSLVHKVDKVEEKKIEASSSILPKHVVFNSWSQWVDSGKPHGDIDAIPAIISDNQYHYVPHFTIIGAQKGGTTYLRWLLVQHPHLESGDGLHGETRGEPHFFDWGYPSKGNNKVLVMEKYAKMFHKHVSSSESSEGTLYFDTTPAYIVEKEVPQRIFDLVPTMKLIAIVRDPTDRYRSELQMEICRARLGQISNQFHSHGKMSDYLKYPPSNIHKPLMRGLYYDQFERWLKLFKRENLLILTSDILYSQSEDAVKEVLSFLKVDLITPNDFKFNYKAPKNAACKKDMAPYIDTDELNALKKYYIQHNEGLDELVSMVFPWLHES